MDDCTHYVCTAHFAFTRLDDSTHLRCYYTPTVSFVLYQCTFLPIYVSSDHFAFTPLYDSTHLRCYCTPTVNLVLHHCMILRIYDATVRRLSVLFYTTVRFYASTFLRLTLLLHHCTMLLYADCQFWFIPLYVLRIYVSTAHFAFTRLDDSTHLRCYCTPTVRNPG